MPRNRSRGRAGSARAAILSAAVVASAGTAMAAAPFPFESRDHREDADGVSPNDGHLFAAADNVARARWLSAATLADEARRQRERERVERMAMWDRLADCETGGNWQDNGEFGGGLGIFVGTWKNYGGDEFAARPQWATKEQQIIVAERIARDGYGGWGCARELGWVS